MASSTLAHMITLLQGSAVHLAAADPTAVAVIRWTGIVAVVIGLGIIIMRWWRDR
ncbi:hypothetical protein I6E29_07250 [Arcanobacterium haemolyticum]|nr:hypothetical protein [Arcanobacterium haemolyticum]